jgi:hypothetical protein
MIVARFREILINWTIPTVLLLALLQSLLWDVETRIHEEKMLGGFARLTTAGKTWSLRK